MITKAVKNEILDTIVQLWEKDIRKDYNEDFLLQEDTLKCAFYYHLRRKLKSLLKENNLRIYTEFNGSEYKQLKYRPDLVIVEMKTKCDGTYIMDWIEDVVVAVEFKFKNKSQTATDSIYSDREKIKEYVKLLDSDALYVLAVIQEKYWDNRYWLDGRQSENWAKGRVTELVASYESEDETHMKFDSKRY